MKTTELLDVKGMTCGGCVANVTRALSAVPGVDAVDVSLPRNAATVQFDDARVSVATLLGAIRAAGYDTPDAPAEAAGGGGCCGS